MIRYSKIRRRQFLIGAGKAVLALPILPSLLPKEAKAQMAQATRRIMMFQMDHNPDQAAFPNPNQAINPIGSDGARDILMRNLGSIGQVSPVFNFPEYQSLLLRNQFTMLRGFKSRNYGPGHGNYSMACGEGRFSEGNYPSIDTVLERSSSVYPSGTPSQVARVVRVSLGNNPYFRKGTGSNPVSATPVYGYGGVSRLFNEVFSQITNGTTTPSSSGENQLKTSILNQVHSSYQAFRSNRNISSEDRQKLNEHMEYIFQAEQSYNQNTQQQNISCEEAVNPGQLNQQAEVNAYLQLLSLAFRCGVTKVGALKFEGHNPAWIPGIGGPGVHDRMHNGTPAAERRRTWETWYRFYMRAVAEHFIRPLDQEEGSTGRTYLDNMIVTIQQGAGLENFQAGEGGHSGFDSQQIILGSMAGRLRAGYYYALPNRNNQRLPLNTYCITLLNLMGVAPTEYTYATSSGRGFGHYGYVSGSPFTHRFYEPVTEVLRG